MSKFFRIATYFIYGLNALLIFFWFYRDQIIVPDWLQTFGRMHPMILHLPIGFFVMGVIIILLKNQFKPKAFKESLNLIFLFTALSLVVTALAGILLSREGGYNSEVLQAHLNSGVILSLIVLIVISIGIKKKLSRTLYALIGLGFFTLVATGHFGATLTHGKNYLLGKKSKEVDSDSITVFTNAVLPVIEKKCGSCHNENKKKGELILISESGILKGGENGEVINSTNLTESEFLKRIHLDLDHDDHMPPYGKPQLTSLELELLNRWVTKGADFKSLVSENKYDSLVVLAEPILASYNNSQIRQYDFDFVSAEEIESLNSPFRTVSQIATNEPALKASYYLAQYFSPIDLNPLKTIQPQLIELNLSGMPIGDNDIDNILSFINLESLNLNNTNITDKGIEKLRALPKLAKLSLIGVKATETSLKILTNSKSLKEVFVWNTGLPESSLKILKDMNKDILWNLGYQPDENEILKLTPPILVNQNFLLKPGEPITLKHDLPGTVIRISIDGTEPDSVNASTYTKPIIIQDHTTLRTVATKAGWLKSNILEFNFYLTGIKPIKSTLLSVPDKNYKAKGIESLTDDNLGDSDNFRDGNWLGFRESKLISEFTFNENAKPNKLTLIYNKNIGSYLMPPESIQVWGGENSSSLQLLSTIKPSQPEKYLPTKTESVSYIFKERVTYVKVIATPVGKLPSWHSGKGKKGWLMVSEIIFR